MAVPNWFKLVVDEGFITDCIEMEGRVLHSTFTTYLPISIRKKPWIKWVRFTRIYFKKTKSNWMYLWDCLEFSCKNKVSEWWFVTKLDIATRVEGVCNRMPHKAVMRQIKQMLPVFYPIFYFQHHIFAQ
jgi:hypothetical protein